MTKIALVTGANRGLGFEICKQLAQLGYEVMLGARNEAQGKKAEKALQQHDLHVRYVKLDLTSDTDRKSLYQLINKDYGRLDVLVNNAGILIDRNTRPSTVTLEDLRQTFEINYFSTVALTQELLPLIKKSDSGRIVNASSSLGSLSSAAKEPLGEWNLLAYNSSKAALNMFTILLAEELQDTPIKVNSAHPGWVKTDMGTEAAPLSVEDGAKTAVRLATLDARGPTGGFFHLKSELPW